MCGDGLGRRLQISLWVTERRSAPGCDRALSNGRGRFGSSCPGALPVTMHDSHMIEMPDDMSQADGSMPQG
jgi:hypothetical protein